MLIDLCRVDRASLLSLQPVTDLFRIPVLSKRGVDRTRGGCGNPRTLFGLPSLKDQAMSLVGPVALLASIPPHLARARGLMNVQDLRNSLLSLLGLHESVDLVPFRLGQLGVGSHECSFDWLIDRDAAEPNSTCPYAQRSKLHLQGSFTRH